MKTRYKVILWLLPLCVIVSTILYQKIFNSGLTVPWKFVGNPSEKIFDIVGFNLEKLYFHTDSGVLYSLHYTQNYSDSIPSPLQWVRENNVKIEPGPICQGGHVWATSPPLFFKVKQICQVEIPCMECGEVVKFALSEDGNLWFWSYGASVYQGLEFLLVLVIEFLVYPFVLIIYFVIFLTKSIIKKLSPSEPD